MNYLFIQTLTVQASTKGYSEPVGLIVFDLPLFVWWLCSNNHYYQIGTQSYTEYLNLLPHSVVWAFPSASMFVRGGTHAVGQDGTFRIHGTFGGGKYKTVKLSVDAVLSRNIYSRPTTCISRGKGDPEFEARGRSYMSKNRKKMLEWLGQQRMNDATKDSMYSINTPIPYWDRE